VRAGRWLVAAAAGVLVALFPVGSALPRPADGPVLSAIHGRFDPNERATHYTATLTPSVNLYFWTFRLVFDKRGFVDKKQSQLIAKA
jgi:hypothetical protein